MYQAVYKCRLCGATHADSLISEDEAEKCLKMFERGKMRYKSDSRRNDVYKYKGHYYCKDGSLGIADFQGFKKVGGDNQ